MSNIDEVVMECWCGKKFTVDNKFSDVVAHTSTTAYCDLTVVNLLRNQSKYRKQFNLGVYINEDHFIYAWHMPRSDLGRTRLNINKTLVGSFGSPEYADNLFWSDNIELLPTKLRQVGLAIMKAQLPLDKFHVTLDMAAGLLLTDMSFRAFSSFADELNALAILTNFDVKSMYEFIAKYAAGIHR